MRSLPYRSWSKRKPENTSQKSSVLSFYLNLEQLGPQFPSDKKPISLIVIGDSVENAFLIRNFRRRNQPFQINPTRNIPRLWVDDCDSLFMPNVCVYLTFDVLELVELLNRVLVINYIDCSRHLKCIGRKKS